MCTSRALAGGRAERQPERAQVGARVCFLPGQGALSSPRAGHSGEAPGWGPLPGTRGSPPSLTGTRPLRLLPAPWSLCPGSATTPWTGPQTGGASTGSTRFRTGSLCECGHPPSRGGPAFVGCLRGLASGVSRPDGQLAIFLIKVNKIQKRHRRETSPQSLHEPLSAPPRTPVWSWRGALTRGPWALGPRP